MINLRLQINAIGFIAKFIGETCICIMKMNERMAFYRIWKSEKVFHKFSTSLEFESTNNILYTIRYR